MRRKLFQNYLLIIMITVGVTSAIFVAYGYPYLVREKENNLISRVSILADSFSHGGEGDRETSQGKAEDLQGMGRCLKEQSEKFGLRLTLIDGEGDVVADSDTDGEKMENHMTRPEVQRAMRNQTGADHRYSQTTGVEYYYAAVKVETEEFYGVLRASEPAEEFDQLVDRLALSICGLLASSILIALALVYYFAKKVTGPLEYMTEKAERIARGYDEGGILEDGYDEAGRLARSFNKMTRSLKIEQERVESQREELASILASMSSGICAVDNGGKLLFYNQPFLNFISFGLGEEDRENLLGKSLYSYFRNEGAMDVISQVEEQEIQAEETALLLMGGEERIIHIKGTPLYRKERKKVGVLLILEDVTKMKKLETMRKDFVSNVTHELRTPLTSIRGFVETLKEGAVEDPAFAQRFLTIIDIEAERLEHLIQDILLLSEIESGTDVHKSMVKVEPVIDGAIELLEKKGKKGVEIKKEMKGKVTDFFCNENRLRELIINLMDNGLKYTNKGSVAVRCWEEKNDLVLQFEDTGLGIPREHLPRLFERFYRVDKGRSRKQGGTGLGLSIVKHIVELYNGSIQVESEPGVGSVFTVRLPYF